MENGSEPAMQTERQALSQLSEIPHFNVWVMIATNTVFLASN